MNSSSGERNGLSTKQVKDKNNQDMKNFILSIDLGTSGPKVALVSTRGEILDTEFEKTRLLLFPGGGAEQDPDEWWDAVIRATKRLLGKQLVPAGDISAISCTAQWSGTVAVDETGTHLMNAVIWMDSRGARFIGDITGGKITFEGYDPRKLFRWLTLTGGAPERSGKSPLAHILYIKNTFPDIYEKTCKFLEPKDYLNMRFTGMFAASYDSIALHWVTDNRDIRRVRYDRDLLAYSTIDPDKLPALVPAGGILGRIKPDIARNLGLRGDVKVVVGTPDVQSAAVGSGAVADYEGHLYIGTSSWLTCHVPFKKTDILHNMASLPSGIPGRYFVGNEQETAGRCIEFLRDNILFPKDALSNNSAPDDFHERIAEAARSVAPGSDKVIFTPWLYGERTPVEDRTVRSGFFNQSLHTTRSHLVRAVFEGVAYNSRWLLNSVERFIKRPFRAINMIGGGAKSELWCQIHADVLGRTIRQVKDPIHANVRGAALLAGLALGHITFDEIAGLVEIEQTFEPDVENKKIYD
ncbi:MAG TPA: xylulose kinase, partial [Deltaproteobacteria bacterium]|nr:xylulose kinase [Deltaproteobacteria bacterium]